VTDIGEGELQSAVTQSPCAIAKSKISNILPADPRALDVAAFVSIIRAWAEHLHSPGFAHNVLNTLNIALDKRYQSVILDFGSYRKFETHNCLEGHLAGSTKITILRHSIMMKWHRKS
jgi:serine/threonine protein kinase